MSALFSQLLDPLAGGDEAAAVLRRLLEAFPVSGYGLLQLATKLPIELYEQFDVVLVLLHTALHVLAQLAVNAHGNSRSLLQLPILLLTEPLIDKIYFREAGKSLLRPFPVIVDAKLQPHMRMELHQIDQQLVIGHQQHEMDILAFLLLEKFHYV